MHNIKDVANWWNFCSTLQAAWSSPCKHNTNLTVTWDVLQKLLCFKSQSKKHTSINTNKNSPVSTIIDIKSLCLNINDHTINYIYHKCSCLHSQTQQDHSPGIIIINCVTIYLRKWNWKHCVLWNIDPVPAWFMPFHSLCNSKCCAAE